MLFTDAHDLRVCFDHGIPLEKIKRQPLVIVAVVAVMCEYDDRLAEMQDPIWGDAPQSGDGHD